MTFEEEKPTPRYNTVLWPDATFLIYPSAVFPTAPNRSSSERKPEPKCPFSTYPTHTNATRTGLPNIFGKISPRRTM